MSPCAKVNGEETQPQSNGKQERWHATLKRECIRPGTPLSVEDARRIVADFVAYYNARRLHSAIGYITPKDKLEGRAEAILDEREVKLAAARQARKNRRQEKAARASCGTDTKGVLATGSRLVKHVRDALGVPAA
jgi:hypothetical protein